MYKTGSDIADNARITDTLIHFVFDLFLEKIKNRRLKNKIKDKNNKGFVTASSMWKPGADNERDTVTIIKPVFEHALKKKQKKKKQASWNSTSSLEQSGRPLKTTGSLALDKQPLNMEIVLWCTYVAWKLGSHGQVSTEAEQHPPTL